MVIIMKKIISFILLALIIHSNSIKCQTIVDISKNELVEICNDIGKHKKIRKLFKNVIINDRETIVFRLNKYSLKGNENLIFDNEIKLNNEFIRITTDEVTFFYGYSTPYLQAEYMFQKNNVFFSVFIYVCNETKTRQVFVFKYIKNKNAIWYRKDVKVIK